MINPALKPKPRMERLVQPLKWHGGKHYLAKRIIELMPEHIHYVEPFFGGGSVLLEKDPEGVSEVINDVHYELTNFWRTLQDAGRFDAFKRIVDVIPFSQVEWEDSHQETDDPIRAAVNFFVRCRQSRAGKLNVFCDTEPKSNASQNERASVVVVDRDRWFTRRGPTHETCGRIE